MSLVRILGALLVLGLAGCAEDQEEETYPSPIPYTGPPPCIVVPETFTLHSVVDWTVEGSLLIANACEGDLEIYDLHLSEGAFELGDLGSVLVPPGRSTELGVRFSPPEVGDWRAELVIDTNDSESLSKVVPLVGEVVEGPLVALPPVLDLRTWVGCHEEAEVLLVNQSSDPIALGQASLLTRSPDLHLETNQLPATLSPGEDAVLVVDYIGLDEEPDEGWLSLPTTDPPGIGPGVPIHAESVATGHQKDTWWVDAPKFRYHFSHRPMARTVEVWVDKTELLEGWTVDEEARELIFEAEVVPQAGALLEVEYLRGVSCDTYP